MKSILILFAYCLGSAFPALAQSRSQMPRPAHVVVVIEENHGYDQLLGSKAAPYFNQIARRSAVFTNSHGVTHPSQPNYLAIFSGSTQGIPDDRCLRHLSPFSSPNLAAALLKKGLTFKGYAQSLPSSGYLECYDHMSTLTGGYIYARKHCPWVDWQGNQANGIPASLSLPMTAFPSDFNRLPTVSFVIPDQDHDMHNIGNPGDSAAIRRGDQWLRDDLGAYIRWAKSHNSLLIITFDEDQFTPANHIPTLLMGAGVRPGHYGQRIDHYSVLHTLEAMYGLPVSDATHASTISGVWN